MNTRVRISIAVLLISMLVAGCETTQTARHSNAIPEAVRAKMGRVEIAFQDGSEVEVTGVTRSKMEGAGKGAVSGAVVGSAVALQGGPFGVLLLPAFAAAGAGSGVIVGAVIADKAETVKANIFTTEGVAATADDQLKESLESELSILEGWEYGIRQAGGASSEGADFDSRVEIQLERFATIGAANMSPTSEISFQWESVARLYLADSGYPVIERRYTFQTPVRSLKKWARDDGLLLEGEISRLSRRTAKRVVDDFFRQGSLFIKPMYPVSGRSFGSPRVNSLNPVLKWDIIDGGSPISPDVEKTIEYRVVLQARSGGRQQFDNLTTNSIELNLDPAETYEWRVQGRYSVRGQERLTQWSPTERFRAPK